MSSESSQPQTPNSRKRLFGSTAIAEEAAETSTKAPKLYPMFSKATESVPSATFHWVQPALGPKKTCLYGINLDPKPHAKVAAFDLDGTIIKSNLPSKVDRGRLPQWEWWNKQVPQKLKQAHDEGYSIIIVSNQCLKAPQLVEWKKKVPLIAASLPDVPFRIFAAIAKDEYRKPMPGIWVELEKIAGAGAGVQIDKSESYFVGDAAGRSGDFAGTDRKWALNVGLKFFTPEEYFLKLPTAPYKLTGFNVASVPKNVPLVTPSYLPLVASPQQSEIKPEIVLFVGFPASGKSTFFKRHFAPAGYAHVNQDTLGTRAKCLKAVEDSVRNGVNCVVDNTNRDAKTRLLYVDLAKRLGASVRCFHFAVDMDLAWHNNLYRAFCQPLATTRTDAKCALVPQVAFSSFKDGFEEPAMDEGFEEIRKVHWVFEGDEKEREHWSMWLQIDRDRK